MTRITLMLLILIAFHLVKAGEHQHHPSKVHHTESSAMTLNNGKKWTSDETLKAQMKNITLGLHKLHGLSEKKNVKISDYAEYSDSIDRATSEIFKNCKLVPKADATLHVILAKILNAKSKLASQHPEEALPEIEESLHLYEKYFQE